MLESIGISKVLTKKEISENLNLIFPKLKFKVVKLESVQNINLVENEIGFFIHETDSDFPIRIELLLSIQINTEKREQYIAHKLSKILNCITIVGYQEENSVIPFLNLVFDNGKIFLADDQETKYANEGENLIKIIKEIKYIIDWSFDEYGKLIKKEDGTQHCI